MSILNGFFRFITRFVQMIQTPFTQARGFMANNPATRSAQVLKSQGQQLRFLTSMPQQMGKRLVPKRFRTVSRGKVAAEDIPEDDPQRAAEFDRARKRRRVRGVARKAAFTQIHITPRGAPGRTVLHIGSATGESFTEYIYQYGTPQAVQLQFWLADETVKGAPLLLRVGRVPGEVTISVDNKLLDGDMPIRNGSVLDVDGTLFDIRLVAYGDLPAVTRVDAVWETNVGPAMEINQDALGIYQHPKAYMFNIADGVGGGYAGEEVSAFSVKYLLTVFKRNIKYTHFSWYDVYAKAFAYTNAEVRNFVQAAPSAAGTTLTSVFIRDWTAYIAHVGDTRIYHLRGINMRQITTDHNETVEIETRNRQGLPVKKRRDILYKAIGRADSIDADIQTLALQPDDILLLVTDGITKLVTDAEIYAVLTTQRFTAIPEELVELANSRNNTDNASTIAIRVLPQAYDRDVWVADPSDRVWVGGPTYPLKLRGPASINTAYSIVTGTGCFLIMLALFIFGLIWSVGQVRQAVQAFRGPPTDVIAVEAINADAAQVTFTVAPDVTATSIHTNTPAVTPTASLTPLPTMTPRPTSTLTQTPTLTPTVTPIPPTSTQRPR